MTKAERKTVELDDLAGDLERVMAAAASRPLTDGEFDTLAARVFRFQFEHNEVYRAYCEGRGARPETLASWQDVPAVPATAFKHLDLSSTTEEPEAVFRTSGTTGGDERRGRHVVPRLSLYRAALLGPFRRWVLAGLDRAPFLSLIPDPAQAPSSSLSWMVGAAAEACATSVRWLVGADGRLDAAGLDAALGEASRADEPVVLAGTALAFVHAKEALDALGLGDTHELPAGSRVMETGGFKGSHREVSRTELRRRISRATGVPPDRVVNEYGMTELLSQLYEPVLEEGPSAAGAHVAPPWLRVRALDPVTLEARPEGRDGILAFFDLANLGSVCHVLTQDVGAVVDGRLRLRGRLAGAEPRGCSRAMDELMTSARVGR